MSVNAVGVKRWLSPWACFLATAMLGIICGHAEAADSQFSIGSARQAVSNLGSLKDDALTNISRLPLPDDQIRYLGFINSGSPAGAFARAVQNFANTHWIKDTETAAIAHIKGAKHTEQAFVLDVEEFVFDRTQDHFALRSDRQARLRELKKTMANIKMLDRLAMVYVADQPFWAKQKWTSRYSTAGVVKQLEKAIKTVERVFGPDVPIGILYNATQFNSPSWAIPQSLDVVGYVCYDGDLKQCAGRSVYEHLDYLQDRMQPHQKFMVVPVAWKGAAIDSSTMCRDFRTLVDIALHERNMFGIFPFNWHGTDGDAGARKIQCLRNALEEFDVELAARSFSDRLETLDNRKQVRGKMGTVDVETGQVKGWAYDGDSPHRMLEIDVYIDGKKPKHFVTTIITDQTNRNLNSRKGIVGRHGFDYSIPPQYRDGKRHTLRLYATDLSLTYVNGTAASTRNYVLLPPTTTHAFTLQGPPVESTPVGPSDWISGTSVRLQQNPLITATTPGWRVGARTENINGPSVIRVPDGTSGALGAYYMYFAHHSGRYIRLAYADSPTGPWKVRPGSVLPRGRAGFGHHVASPDVVIDPVSGKWRMYFHGYTSGQGDQTTRVAISKNGLYWTVPDKTDIAPYYLRVVPYKGEWIGVAKHRDKSLVLMRSKTGLGRWTRGPFLIPNGRHVALEIVGNRLLCYFSRIGDTPESILVKAFDLTKDWKKWEATAATETLVLEPSMPYEGIQYPIKASLPGSATGVRQLRDPYVFRDSGTRFLYYTVAGEEAIAATVLNLKIAP